MVFYNAQAFPRENRPPRWIYIMVDENLAHYILTLAKSQPLQSMYILSVLEVGNAILLGPDLGWIHATLSELPQQRLLFVARTMISTSLQAFQLIFSLTSLVDRGLSDLGSLFETGRVLEYIEETEKDASSIIAVRDNESHLSSFTFDHSDGIDGQLTLEEELALSGPYARRLSTMLYDQLKQRSPTTGAASDETPGETSTPTTYFNRKRSAYGQKSTWSRNSQSSGGVPLPTATPLSPTSSTGFEAGIQGQSPISSVQRLIQIEDINHEDIEIVKRRLSRASLKSIKWKVSSRAATYIDDLCSHIKIGNLEGIRQSLVNGAYIDGYDKNGFTPLMTAIMHRQLGIAEYLLKLGADVRLGYRSVSSQSTNVSKIYTALTPIHKAAEQGDADAIRLLEKYRSDVNDLRAVMGGDKHTPLYLAHGDAVQQLIDLGGNVFQATKLGATPLARAARRGDHAAIECLAYNGADVNSISLLSNTEEFIVKSNPLIRAVHSTQCVKVLLHNGADPNAELVYANVSMSTISNICQLLGGLSKGAYFYPDIKYTQEIVDSIQALVDGGSKVELRDLDSIWKGGFPGQNSKERKQLIRIFCAANPELLEYQLKLCFKTYKHAYSARKVVAGVLPDSANKKPSSVRFESFEVKDDAKIGNQVLEMFEETASMICILLADREAAELEALIQHFDDGTEEGADIAIQTRPEARFNRRYALPSLMASWNRADQLMNSIGSKLWSSLRAYLAEHGAEAYGILFPDVASSESDSTDAGLQESKETNHAGASLQFPEPAGDLQTTARVLVDQVIAELVATEEAARLKETKEVEDLVEKIRKADKLARQAKAAAETAEGAKLEASPTIQAKARKFLEGEQLLNSKSIIASLSLCEAG
ncbi:ankyrin [Paramyrothecium foliicola]|nr:ankyrin [Paramyrothecium foliicola]